ncbi:MAG: transcriptional regulator [Spirochaetes bacterium]|uniref:Transcriptional regulator n=1 Tax=Candidatus Aphodenecus pullistercoris TaxID=2840669 RepID=A0A9D9E8P7_9SPIR|nr:transcriptional regulator [Candidatus Aphodenecus pullistercoris]
MDNDLIRQQALDDFHRAKSRARMQGLFSKLSWKNPDLLSLYEVTSIIKPKKETYLGMQTIEVDKIIGSENRYRDFSAAFLPKHEMLRGRWTSVDQARLSDVVLPPISVFSLGGYYFVRDGNHRVSVARSQGAEFIDAEVVELDSEIKLEPGMTTRQLRQRVVDYERAAFIEQYRPSYLPMGEIVFTTPGSYPEMVNHILVHKYYINQNVEGEISFEDAARSWYKNVYAPIVRQIREDKLMLLFPGNAEGDLYMWLVRRWDEMKKQKKDASIAEASRQIRKESSSSSSLVHRWISAIKSKLSTD